MMTKKKFMEWLDRYKFIFLILLGLLLWGGLVVADNRFNNRAPVTVMTTMVQATTTQDNDSKLKALLEASPSAEAIKAIEDELAKTTDAKIKEQLEKRLAELKAQVQSSSEVAQVTTNRLDETSEVSSQETTTTLTEDETEESLEETTTLLQTTQRVVQTQAPVTTTETPVETTTEVPITSVTRAVVMGGLGNSGREFQSQAEAESWAQPQLNGSSRADYHILSIIYSDGTVSYSVDWVSKD